MSITSRNRHLHIVSQICSSSKPNSWKMVESSAVSLSNYSNLFWFYFVLIVCCNYDFVVDFALVPLMFLHFLLPSYQAYEHLWAMHSDKKTIITWTIMNILKLASMFRSIFRPSAPHHPTPCCAPASRLEIRSCFGAWALNCRLRYPSRCSLVRLMCAERSFTKGNG